MTDKEIIFKIWTSPRNVFKYINDNQFDKYTTKLLVLAGICSALDKASLKNLGDQMSLFKIIGMSIFIGGGLSWIFYSLYASTVSLTGKLFKGQGNTTSILRILSFAMIPFIISLFLYIPQIGIYGVEIFKSDGDIFSGNLFSNIIMYSITIIAVILEIWTLVLCVIGISEVQKISIIKSILNLLLPILLYIIIILSILFLLDLI